MAQHPDRHVKRAARKPPREPDAEVGPEERDREEADHHPLDERVRRAEDGASTVVLRKTAVVAPCPLPPGAARVRRVAAVSGLLEVGLVRDTGVGMDDATRRACSVRGRRRQDSASVARLHLLHNVREPVWVELILVIAVRTLAVMGKRNVGNRSLSKGTPTSKMWSAALHVCALCGDVAAATEIFADMRASGSAPNVHSCTALMRAYASVRDLSGAIDAYWTMRNEFDVAPDSSTLQTMLEVVRAAGHNKSRGTSDVISRVQEVYADMRALNVRLNNAVLSLLTESVVEDVLALGSPNSAIDVKRLTLAIDGCVSVESEITQTWDDIASMNLKEYSVAEARVAFLGLLQTLRDRRAARLRVGDVRVGVGRLSLIHI